MSQDPSSNINSTAELLEAIHVAVVKAEGYWKDRDAQMHFHLNCISYDLGRARIALQKTKDRLEQIRKEKPNGKEH